MVRANNSREDYFPEINNYIKEYGIGGVCFFGSGAMKQAKQTNTWQKISTVPLLTAIDGEWGLGMRLDSTISFPFQLTLGSIENDSLIFAMGQEIARECKRIGLDINFAPVVDININPKNPVINSRSFGDNPQKVSRKAMAYMQGLQSEGIIASAKHFPGHGDTDSDSHKTLPIINHTYARLDSVELIPFKKLINNGLKSVMVAHLYIPALENTEHSPSTLSPKIVNGLLRDSLNFQGLVITDALDMGGVTKYVEPGEIEVQALLAGNDILLLPKNVPAAIDSLKKALETGRIDSNYLAQKVKKILHFKYQSGIKQEIALNNLYADLNNASALALKQQLYEEASILLKNNNNILPFSSNQKLNVLSIGLESENAFVNTLEKYTNAEHFSIDKIFSDKEEKKLINNLADKQKLIVALGGTSIFPTRKFGLTPESKELIHKLAATRDVVFVFFGSPIAYSQFLNSDSLFAASIIAHQDNDAAAQALAQQLMGALPFKGSLPIQINSSYPNGYGIKLAALKKLSYGYPEQENLSSKLLTQIDTITLDAIKDETFPGCQIVVAKNGRIVYSKSFGYQTYNKQKPIDRNSIYDLASITKIAATTASLMKLQGEGKFNTNNFISEYLPYLKGTNKDSMRISAILTHQARLTPWIPFYLSVLDSTNQLNPDLFSKKINDTHAVRVAQNLYIDKNYAHKMYDTIAHSDLWGKDEYKYSDLGFYWFRQLIELETNQALENYVVQNFYQPMGLHNIDFLPRQHFNLERIVPTEYDSIFRKQLIHGDVHDPGAAMLGGVSGHAGLFSNAEDLAAVFQLFLQNGYYAGQQLLDSAIIAQYTAYQYDYSKIENRRGLGFDKPYPEYDSLGPVCESASLRSYGHSGFTGTYAWVDPEHQLVYIFLSNRVYPDATNNKISKNNIRTRIHQAIYDAIINDKKEENEN